GSSRTPVRARAALEGPAVLVWGPLAALAVGLGAAGGLAADGSGPETASKAPAPAESAGRAGPGYLLPGPRGEAAGGTALAAPALLARLRELGRPPFAPPPVAVLVSGAYEGGVVNDQAEFSAVFQARSLADGPVTLEVPLAGVGLEGDVLVDGARAFP